MTETGKEKSPHGFTQKILDSIAFSDPDQLCDNLIDLDKTLLGRKSVYREVSERARLLEDLEKFIEKTIKGQTSYVFYMSGQMDRLQIFVDPEETSVNISPNSFKNTHEKWQDIK